jgi:hypothetical protein
MEVICFEDEAYYSMIEKVVARLKSQHNIVEDKWINAEQAMKLLNITSKSTLQTLRDQGKIRFSQPQKKIIVYDRASILEHLEKHTRNTF